MVVRSDLRSVRSRPWIVQPDCNCARSQRFLPRGQISAAPFPIASPRPHARSVPIHQFEPVPGFVRKDEQRPAPRVLLQLRLRQRPQAIVLIAHVYRLYRQIDLQPRRERQHPSPFAGCNARTNSATAAAFSPTHGHPAWPLYLQHRRLRRHHRRQIQFLEPRRRRSRRHRHHPALSRPLQPIDERAIVDSFPLREHPLRQSALPLRLDQGRPLFRRHYPPPALIALFSCIHPFRHRCSQPRSLSAPRSPA